MTDTPSATPSATSRWKNLVRRFKATLERHLPLLAIAAVVFALFVGFFYQRMFVTLDVGHAGVLFRRFQGGLDMDHVYGEGFYLVAPWNRMDIYDTRILQVPDEFDVLSNDGLTVHVEVSIRYEVRYDKLPDLHREVGPDYVEKIVKPQVQAELRRLLGQFRPDEIYTSQSFILQTAVQGVLEELADRNIILDDLLIKSITLPKTVQASIESKLSQQQEALEYTFRVDKEGKEADRKRIEAQGIADFQKIVTAEGQASFEDYLRYSGIAATLELAKSENAKVVIIGGGQDKLPLILNTDTPAAPARSVGSPPASSRSR